MPSVRGRTSPAFRWRRGRGLERSWRRLRGSDPSVRPGERREKKRGKDEEISFGTKSEQKRRGSETHGDESPLEEVKLDGDWTPRSGTEEFFEEFERSVAETSVRDGFLRGRDESNEVADDVFSQT